MTVAIDRPQAPDRQLMCRGVRLEAATIGWNVVEAVIALTAGLTAGSVALTGFGLDSAIEIAAAGLVLIRLRSALSGQEFNKTRERRALRAIAITFVALASYLLADGIGTLLAGSRPHASPVGIGVTAIALIVMPSLAIAKRRTGRALGNQLLVRESAESALCASLAGTTLVALAVYAATGAAWVDPVAGFVIAGYALKEAREAWEGEPCEG